MISKYRDNLCLNSEQILWKHNVTAASRILKDSSSVITNELEWYLNPLGFEREWSTEWGMHFTSLKIFFKQINYKYKMGTTTKSWDELAVSRHKGKGKVNRCIKYLLIEYFSIRYLQLLGDEPKENFTGSVFPKQNSNARGIKWTTRIFVSWANKENILGGNVDEMTNETFKRTME
jgi:hypothetical protein